MRETFHPPIESEENREEAVNEIREALDSAGLFEIVAPKPGTPAYERLMKAAEGYINMVRVTAGERANSVKTKLAYHEVRRKFHDQLCDVILGKPRNELDNALQDQVSNFAAYLMGAEEYIDTW